MFNLQMNPIDKSSDFVFGIKVMSFSFLIATLYISFGLAFVMKQEKVIDDGPISINEIFKEFEMISDVLSVNGTELVFT